MAAGPGVSISQVVDIGPDAFSFYVVNDCPGVLFLLGGWCALGAKKFPCVLMPKIKPKTLCATT